MPRMDYRLTVLRIEPNGWTVLGTAISRNKRNAERIAKEIAAAQPDNNRPFAIVNGYAFARMTGNENDATL